MVAGCAWFGCAAVVGLVYTHTMIASTFADKKCFVTGAASGIGRALAFDLGRRGAMLYLTDIDAAGLAATVSALRAEGANVARADPLDIARFEDVRSLAAAVQDEAGSMDALFNVAGIAVWGTVDRLAHDDWRRTIDVNLMGPIHVIECFVPAMIRAGRGGHLVNVSSAAGLFGFPWHAAYSASKFGLRGLSEVLRFDLRRHGIAVTLVCPGAVNTGLVQTIRIAGVDPSRADLLAMKAHFVRVAVTPERAARAILRGVERKRFLVFTSTDIRVGYWIQRKFAWPYELVMRLMNHAIQRFVAPRD